MKRGYRSGFVMLKQRRPTTLLLSALVTLTLLLGACGDNGNGDNNADNGGAAAATATSIPKAPTATPTAATQSDAMTETVQAAETTGITNEVESGVADVAVLTSTQLITGTEVTTEVKVSTDTVVIEQQLITTVITNTDLISNVVESSDSSSTSQTEVITDSAKLTPESSTGKAVADVTVTPLAPTATPRATAQATKVATATVVVTSTKSATPVATPQASQGQTTGTAVQTAGSVYTGVVDAQGKTILASTLLDSNFLTSDGEVSGEVQDAVIDMQTGQLLYILLEYGGVLDVGDSDLPVPPNAFSLKEDGALLLNIPPEDLQQFPDVGNDWPQADNSTWDADVRNFWSKEGFDAGFDAAESGNRIRRVSNLLNAPTADAGLGAGTIEDMMISLDQGRVAYLLVSFADGAPGDDWYAIPLSAFNSQAGDNELAFGPNFNASLLEGAPRFNKATSGQDRFLPGDYDIDWRSFWNKLTNP